MNYISPFRSLLQRLYNLGARRVLVTGTGPLGCVPAELAMRSTNGGCSAELQRAAALYNPQLERMIIDVNRKIGSDVFIAANTHQMHADFVSNPQAYGTQYIPCRQFTSLLRIQYYMLIVRYNKKKNQFFWFGRIYYIKDSMLWTRALQWPRTVHTVVKLVP